MLLRLQFVGTAESPSQERLEKCEAWWITPLIQCALCLPRTDAWKLSAWIRKCNNGVFLSAVVKRIHPVRSAEPRLFDPTKWNSWDRCSKPVGVDVRVPCLDASSHVDGAVDIAGPNT